MFFEILSSLAALYEAHQRFRESEFFLGIGLDLSYRIRHLSHFKRFRLQQMQLKFRLRQPSPLVDQFKFGFVGFLTYNMSSM